MPIFAWHIKAEMYEMKVWCNCFPKSRYKIRMTFTFGYKKPVYVVCFTKKFHNSRLLLNITYEQRRIDYFILAKRPILADHSILSWKWVHRINLNHDFLFTFWLMNFEYANYITFICNIKKLKQFKEWVW